MSSKKDPDVSQKSGSNEKTNFSRRGFLGGLGIGGGALGTGILTTGALATPADAATGVGPGAVPVTLKINGKNQNLTVEPRVTLCDALRNRLDLTGAKYGCGEGQCGACTVLLDGRAARSCITPVSAAAGARIVTIEGLERDGKLTPVQQAFLEEGAFQCGYCTSGMIMQATSLLSETSEATEEQIVSGMNGNICRCGTYPRIVQAVRMASRHAATQEAKHEHR